MKLTSVGNGGDENVDLACRSTSLPAAVTQTMVRALEAGRWIGDLPGERKLCDLLQVSRVTLRPALQELERLGWVRTEPGQRRKIVKRAKIDQVPTSGQRVVLILPVPLQSIEAFTLLSLDHLRELLVRRSILLETETRPRCYGRYPDRALERLCRESRADVWLLWRSTKKMQDWFRRAGHKHVVIGTAFIRHSTAAVDLDHVATARHAAAVFGRMGHRRIAVVVCDSKLAGDHRSLEGFCAGAEEYEGGALQADLLKHDGTPESIIHCVDRILQFNPRPTGIFSAGGRQTVAIMTRLLQLGVRIPSEMSVISRDDDPVLDFVTPAPARYFRPPIKLARAVLRQIERQLSVSSQDQGPSFIFPEFLPKATLARAAGPAANKVGSNG